MSALFYIKQNDTGPSIAAVLTEDDAITPINLTTADEVRFKMDKNGTLLDAVAIIVSAAAGSVRYDWQDGDTDTIGVFDAEFEITWASGQVQTVPNRSHIKVYVTADLDE